MAFVTGASSGIGFETAKALSKSGFTVYGGARRLDKLEALKKFGVKVLPLDVTDEFSMKKAVETIFSEEGRLDVLVNNAGYGQYGAVEDTTISEARNQFEVNIFGLARLTQLVLPIMREQKSGKIVNISSVGGKIWTAFGAWYHATKYALEGFSDCLRVEVKPFGIDVILVEPGMIATEWGEIAADHLLEVSRNGAYAKTAANSAQMLKKTYSGTRLTDPALIASVINKAVQKRKPKTRYLVGRMAKPAVFMKTLVSDRIYDWMITKIIK